MFAVGDTVLYSLRGLCRIEELVLRDNTQFYRLVPVFSQTYSIFVPAIKENEAKMRKILSCEEITAMIADVSSKPLKWIDDDKNRAVAFKDIMASGNRLEIMRLIRLLYEHQLLLKEKSKKLHIADERVFKDAEELLYDEFAYVLNIKRNQVVEFIADKISVSKK